MDKWPRTGALMLVGNLSNTYALACQYARQLLSGHHARNTLLLDAGTHPDLKCIVVEQGHFIKVDQLRDLIAFSNGTPQIASQKVAIVYPAQAMNIQAANALLKTLEEPGDDMLIVLVTDKPALLPATIRSRCFTVRCARDIMRTIPDSMPQDIDAIISGKIDASQVAERWIKQQAPKELLDGLWIILSQKTYALAEEGRVIREKSWWLLVDHITEVRRQLEEWPSFNAQLFIENILFKLVGKNYVC